MRVGARIAMLTLLVSVLVGLLVEVSRRLQVQPPVPASISNSKSPRTGTSPREAAVLPRAILEARPAGGESGLGSPVSPSDWGTPVSVSPPSQPSPAGGYFPPGDSLLDPRRDAAPDRSPSAGPKEGAEGTSGESFWQRPAENDVRPDPNAHPWTTPAAPQDPSRRTETLDAPLRVQTRENDSFWSISERVYGTGAYYKALYQVNRDRVPLPDRIPAGLEILTPPRAELHRLYPDLCQSAAKAAPLRQ
jgi:nucleoid-associated protein YgaU